MRARPARVKLPEAAEAREKMGLTQQAFASMLGVSPRTLQDWEQGRCSPTGAAKTLLRVAVAHPEVLRELSARAYGAFISQSGRPAALTAAPIFISG